MSPLYESKHEAPRPNRTLCTNPNDTLFITRKTAKNPFKIFYEFQDPSNNMTFMRYIPGLNPFDLFDFTQAIPNPGTREKAKVDEAYRKRYKPYKSRQ